MATHDYVIDNQSAPSLRADLNSALQAIVTQNSSATAPTTTYANMIWYDTANNQLKKRNEADSGWITLGTIDEGLGTFTPSGERALATQVQAEAGTNNTTLMTPLRVGEAIRRIPRRVPLYALIPPSGAAVLINPLPLGVSLVFDLSELQCSVTTNSQLRFRASTSGGSTFTGGYFNISALANWNANRVYGRLKILNVGNAVSGLTTGFEFSTSSGTFNNSVFQGIFPDISSVVGINAIELSFTTGNVVNTGRVFVTYEYEG